MATRFGSRVGRAEGGYRFRGDLRASHILAVYQNRLLPPAWRLVGAMNATCPAAGPFLSLQQFFTGSLNAALTRRLPFRVFDPADEFIAAEGREGFPQREYTRACSHRGLKVLGRVVNSAMLKGIRHKLPTVPGSADCARRGSANWLAA